MILLRKTEKFADGGFFKGILGKAVNGIENFEKGTTGVSTLANSRAAFNNGKVGEGIINLLGSAGTGAGALAQALGGVDPMSGGSLATRMTKKVNDFRNSPGYQEGIDDIKTDWNNWRNSDKVKGRQKARTERKTMDNMKARNTRTYIPKESEMYKEENSMWGMSNDSAI